MDDLGKALTDASGEQNELAPFPTRDLAQSLSEVARLTLLGSLSAALVHELNNPLAVVQGFSDIIKKKVAGDRTLEKYCDKISSSATRMGHLIAKVKSLRSITGNASQESEPVTLANVVEDAFLLLAFRTKSLAINIKKDIADIKVLVEGEGMELVIILYCLLVNAIDACQARGDDKTAEIGIRASLKEDELIVAISDNGVGIPEALQDRILEPFVKGQHATGVGLGLTLVTNLLTKIGAKLSFSSESERGSTFTLSFPLAKDPQGVTVALASSLHAPA